MQHTQETQRESDPRHEMVALFYERVVAAVHRLSDGGKRLRKSGFLCDDIAQIVLLKWLERGPECEDESAHYYDKIFFAWCRQAIKNFINDLHRSQQRHATRQASDCDLDEPPAPIFAGDESDVLVELETALAVELSQDEHSLWSAVKQSILEGRPTCKETLATRLGLQAGTVKNRQTKLLAKVRSIASRIERGI